MNAVNANVTNVWQQSAPLLAQGVDWPWNRSFLATKRANWLCDRVAQAAYANINLVDFGTRPGWVDGRTKKWTNECLHIWNAWEPGVDELAFAAAQAISFVAVFGNFMASYRSFDFFFLAFGHSPRMRLPACLPVRHGVACWCSAI